jgi:hypothetical protein
LNVNFLCRCKLSIDVGMGYDPRSHSFDDRAGNAFPHRRQGPPGDPHRQAMLDHLGDPNTGLLPMDSKAAALLSDDLKLDLFSAALDRIGLPPPPNGGEDYVLRNARRIP